MPRRKKEIQPHEEIKKIKNPPLAKGMKDILPADGRYWDYVEGEALRIVRDYSYTRVITPAVERFELFNHSLYKQNGQLEQDSFFFSDHGEKLILRPEFFSGMARSYLDHNLSNQPMPLKIYSWGPVFRQTRGEQNKQRQFTQISYAIMGDGGSAIDAELIITAHHLFKNLGLETEVRLNSLGCVNCRYEYNKALSGYLKTKRQATCIDCKKRTLKDPMKFFACDNARCIKLREDAPQIIDWLCDDCRNHLFRVLEYLDESKISYKLDPTLIRPFDFYNRTIFEMSTPVGGETSDVIAGGGRFDSLVEMYSGPSTPAAGFSFGIEKVINQMKAQKAEMRPADAPDVFVAQLGELSRQKAFNFFEKLRGEHFSVRANFSKASLKDQLDLAKKHGAKLVLILGQKEVMEETVIIREMDSGNQEVINFSRVITEVKKRLKDLA